MQTKIIAIDEMHLRDLIQNEIKLNGNRCNLNHIDVSNVINMTRLFPYSEFDGDISEWNVSNVTNMSFMFCGSTFSGNISK